MVSIQSKIRVILIVVSSIVLVLMVYINFHATSSDVGDGGFSRMLEQSLGRSSGADGGGGEEGDSTDDFDEGTKVKIGWLEETARLLEQMSDSLEGELVSLVNKTKRGARVDVAKGGADAKGKNADDKLITIDSTEEEEPTKKIADDESNTREKKESEEAKTTQQAPPSDKNLTGMNILLLYADDWTHHTLSAMHGVEPVNTLLKTPVLDALAADGVRFTHNCVTTSVCWISRATLYTGQYMSRHNTKEPCCWGGMKKPKKKLGKGPKDWFELSFYELLAKEGYHVGHAGKWGVYLPWDKGVHFNVEDDGWHYRKLGKKMWHITEKNEADALRFLVTRPKDKPFLLNVAFFATHARDGDVQQYRPQNSSMGWYEDDVVPNPPTGTNEAWKRMPYFFGEKNEGRTRWHWRFDNYTKRQTMMKNYYRMATEVDAACGVILEELRRQDALDNTVIIFTTDNGNYHGEHGLADKWYPHQESIRVPLIIRDPRMALERRGTTNDEMTLNVDLAPTILGFAGVPVPEKMMGRDVAPLYLSPSSSSTTSSSSSSSTTSSEWRKEFFYEHPVISHKEYIPASEALVRKDYKYMYWPNYKFEQLFDLVNDPGEMEDIINSTDPSIVTIKVEMRERFRRLKKLVKSDGKVTV